MGCLSFSIWKVFQILCLLLGLRAEDFLVTMKIHDFIVSFGTAHQMKGNTCAWVRRKLSSLNRDVLVAHAKDNSLLEISLASVNLIWLWFTTIHYPKAVKLFTAIRLHSNCLMYLDMKADQSETKQLPRAVRQNPLPDKSYRTQQFNNPVSKVQEWNVEF